MRGFVKIDRTLLELIDRTQPLSKFEAVVDIVQMATLKETVVESHGVKVTLQKGQVLLSFYDCQRRWDWTKKAVRYFITTLCGCGFLAYGGTIAKVGSVYDVNVEPLGGTLRGTINTLEDNELSDSKGTNKGTNKGTKHLIIKKKNKKKEKEKEKESFGPGMPTKEQWFRFRNWAAQNAPNILRQITPTQYETMRQQAGGDTGTMAEALTYMEHKRLGIDKYNETLTDKPWTDGHRLSG